MVNMFQLDFHTTCLPKVHPPVANKLIHPPMHPHYRELPTREIPKQNLAPFPPQSTLQWPVNAQPPPHGHLHPHQPHFGNQPNPHQPHFDPHPHQQFNCIRHQLPPLGASPRLDGDTFVLEFQLPEHAVYAVMKHDEEKVHEVQKSIKDGSYTLSPLLVRTFGSRNGDGEGQRVHYKLVVARCFGTTCSSWFRSPYDRRKEQKSGSSCDELFL